MKHPYSTPRRQAPPKGRSSTLFSASRWLWLLLLSALPLLTQAAKPTLVIQGLNTSGGDNTAFVDRVEIVRTSDNLVMGTAVANAGFETASPTIAAGNFVYSPSGASWIFNGNSGIARNGSGFGNPTAPEGTAGAIVQTSGFLQQTLNLAPGTYYVRMYAAQRNCCSGTNNQTLGVLVNGTSLGTVQPPNNGAFAQYTFSSFTVAAAPGNALAFDGGDYVHSNGTLPATGEFTLEAWVNPAAFSGSLDALVMADNFPTGAMHCQFYNNNLGFSVNGNNPTDMISTSALPTGRWSHVAVVYSASARTVRFYVNGQLNASGTYTTAINIGALAYSLGGWFSGAPQRYFNGRLDEVRMYTTTLTQAQIQADMASTNSAVPASLATYFDFDQGIASGNNSGVTTLYDQAGGSTAALNGLALSSGNTTSNWVESYAMVLPTATAALSVTGNSFTADWTAPAVGTVTNYILDVSTDNTFTAPITGSPFTVPGGTTSRSITGLAASTTYYYRVRADKTSVTGQGAYSSTISTTTLSCSTTAVAQNVTTTLNAGGTATITAAQVNNGSSSNCTPITTSVSPASFTCADVTPSSATNPALSFNGTNQYVSLPATTPVPVGNSAYTIEAWIKPNQMGVYGIIGWGNYGTNSQVTALRLSPGGIHHYWWNNDLGANVGSLVGAWHHVVASFDGTTRRLYLDGTQVAADNPAGHAVPNANNLRIASTCPTSCGGEYFPGSIDEVRVWNRALTAAEVSSSAGKVNPTSLAGLVVRYALNEGSGTTTAEFLGNGGSGTLVNAPTWTTPGIAYSTPMTVLTVSDANGNTSRAAASVTVQDNLAPTVVTQNISVQLSAAGTASITAAQVNNGSSDNCTTAGNLTLSVSPSSFTCANATARTANQYALDFDGNNDYVNLGGGNILTGGSYTKEAWVYANANSCRNILSANNQHQLWLQGNLQAGNSNAYGTVQDPSGAFPLNTWIHVAVTYDQPTSTMRLYRNGTLVATNTAAPTYTGGLIQIGAHGNGCNFDGLIDEVRIWNSARSAAQIAATKDVTLAGNEAGLLAYYNFENGPNSGTLADVSGNGRTGTLTNMATATAWVASTAPITGGTGTTVTLTVSDANGNSSTGTALVSVIAPPAATITSLNPASAGAGAVVTVTGTNLSAATGLTVNGVAATISNLTATSFTFVVPATATGSGNVVVNMPCSQTVSSPFTVMVAPGNALAFDGVGDLVAIPNNPAFSLTTAITLEAWVRTTVTTEQYITTKAENSWYLALNGAGAAPGRLSFYLNNVSTGSGGWLYGTTNLADGRWHHVAGTYDGTTLRMYVDGVQENSRTVTATIPTGGSPVYIGNRPTFPLWNGSIDELRIHSQALTAAQIQADMVSTSTSPGLVAYFNFDQGTPSGNNAGLTTLYDRSGTYAATLTAFNLSNGNSTSNWVESYAMVRPTATAATAVTATGFTTNWTAPVIGTVDNGYRIDVSTSSTFATVIAGSPFTAASGTSQAITGLTPRTTYYYRVRADKTSVTGQGASSNTITVTTPSNVSTLSNLVLSAGALSPAFASGTFVYSVSTTGTSTTVTPTVTQANATVTVNGTAVTSGTASASIPLSIGANNINILVTAQDGTSQTAYVVTVTRNCAVTAVAQNITVALGATGTVSVPATSVNNGSSSTCAPVSYGFQTQGTVGAIVNEGGTLSLTAPAGATFTAVTFASYGTPNGSAGSFTYGTCHGSNSKSVVEGYLLGNGGTINIPANNGVFGDPCLFTGKRLAVQATYTFGSPVTQLSYTCANLGSNNVTLTVTDANGNFSTATATITVVDNTAPVFTACGDGTSASPFTNLNCAKAVATGTYWFTIGGNTFQGYVDGTTDGGGWVEILNYVHAGGTNPTLNVRTTDLPVQTSAVLGANESGSAAWGHAAPALVAALNPQELRFYAQTSAHSRVIHFKTTHAGTLTYFKTGTGNTSGINTSFTALPGHTANIPAQAVDFYFNEGNLAMTRFPFWLSGTYHWGIQGNGNRWEVDDFPNNSANSTVHRIFVRGSATATPGTPVVASAAAGQCGANVTLAGTQAVSDNCTAAPTVTFSPAPGSFFSVGTTPVTATATDANGNSSTSTFNVTVNDTQAPVFAVCGTGTAGNPFTNLSCLTGVATGTYWFNIGGNTFQGYVDGTTDGGGWVEILNYVHAGGTNPALNARTTSLPVQTAAVLGANESASATAWGHAAPALVSSLNPQEVRFYGQTSAHTRVIHFKTTLASVLSYLKTGTGSMSNLGAAGTFTALAGHTANLPASADAYYSNQGTIAATEVPIYRGSTNHWGIRGAGSRWEMDDFPNNSANSTIHRIFVRGSTSAATGTPVVANNTTGQCGANVTLTGTQTVTDNCSATVTFSPASGSFFNVGTTNVTATATDAAGNSSTSIFAVTVKDTQAPVITSCPAAITSTCSTSPSLGTPTATDNCSVASITNNAPSPFPVGTTVVTWTATDASGLTATCTQNVTVQPTPAAPTVTNASRCGTGSVTLTASGAPSGGSYAWYTVASGGTAIAGATSATYTTPSLSATTFYYVSAVNSAANGSCVGPRSLVTATITPIPTVSITPSGATSLCPGGTVNLTANPAGPVPSATPSGYCASAPSNVHDQDIGNVTFAGINNGNPFPTYNNNTQRNSYSDFTSTVTPALVQAGNTYPLSLSYVSSGGFFASYIAVFIDYNFDGDFSDAGERVYNGRFNNDIPLTGSVTIPAGTATGTTRMRVTMQETPAVSGQPQPCGTYDWGETEDYLVTIGYTYSWSPSTGLSATNTATVTATPGATTTYTVTVSDGACSNTATQTVTINAIPSAPAAADVSRCGAGSVTLTASGAPSGGSYAWYTVASGGTAISGATGSTYNTPSLSTNTTYYVSVLNAPANGSCESTRTPVTAIINSAPAFTSCPINQTAPAANDACSAVVTYTASASGSPASTFTYAFTGATTGSGSGTGSGATFNVGTTTVTITAANGCAPNATCTFTVTVNDTQAPSAPSALPAAPAAAVANVPEAAGYGVLYQLNIPNVAQFNNQASVPYAVNNSGASIPRPNRVAYYMELTNGTGTKWVWASMNNFATTLTQLGVPHPTQNNVVWSRPVTGLNVFSSTGAGVTTGTNVGDGRVEIWPWNYAATNIDNVSGASGTTYDFGDQVQLNTGGHGSFQVHNVTAAQTVFAYNNWGINNQVGELGIGNNTGSSGNPDWTFQQTANTYTVKTIYILVPNGRFTKPATVALAANGTGTLTAAQVYAGNATDNCGGTVTASVTPSSFTCAEVGDNTVTVTLTDANSNTTTQTALVTVTAPPTATISSLSPAAARVGATVTVNGTNLSGATALTVNGATATISSLTATSFTFVVPAGATSSGNVSVSLPCSQTLTRAFTVTPSLSNLVLSAGAISPVFAPGTLSYTLTVPGTTTSTTVTPTNAQTTGGTITVNGTAVTSGTASGSIALNPGTNTITVVVNPVGGGTATTYTVTVTRTPCVVTAVAQNLTVNLDAAGSVTVTAAQVDNGSSSTCGAVSLGVTSTVERFTNGDFTSNANGWTPAVIDGSGGWRSTNGNPGGMFILNDSGQAGSDPSLSQTVSGLTVGANYIIRGDYRAYYTNNVGTTAFAIDINGTQATTLTSPGQTWTAFSYSFTATAASQTIRFRGEINGSDVDIAIDNLSLRQTSSSNVTFTCANIGANPVTLYVTDGYGGSATASATITVVDNIAPTVVTQNVTVSLNASGTATVTGAQVNNGSSDNCTAAGSLTLSVSPSSFTCANAGPNTVTLTVTDANGNSNTGTATVTVVDNLAPA